MRSLWKLFSVMTLSGALLLTGCGGKENETAADQPKLTPTQVIDKSMQTMEKGGHTYDVKTNQTITVASGDVSQAIKTRNTSTIDVTMNPVALHLKGKTESSGASEEIEMFLADNALYNKIPQMGWVKTTVDTSAMDASQDPMSGIKQVEQLFEKFMPPRRGRPPQGCRRRAARPAHPRRPAQARARRWRARAWRRRPQPR